MIRVQSLTSLLGCGLVAILAGWRYETETRRVAVEDPIQCGHIALARAAQWMGVPVRAEQLQLLPGRPTGMSLAELCDGFAMVGIHATVHSGGKRMDLPQNQVVVVRLNRPDHFAVAIRRADGLLIHDLAPRPVIVPPEEVEGFDQRFSGWWLELERVSKPRDQWPDDGFPRFESLIQDAGDIDDHRMGNGTVEFSFPLINEGQRPLNILRVEAGYDCVRLDWPKEPIPPGESGRIVATYHARLGNTDGEFSQELTVETDSVGCPNVILTVAGAFRGRLSVLPMQIMIRGVRGGEERRQFLLVDVPMKIRKEIPQVAFRAVDLPEFIHVQFSPSTLAEYNAAMKAAAPGYLPVRDRPGLLVWTMDLKLAEDAVPGYHGFGVELGEVDRDLVQGGSSVLVLVLPPRK